MRETEKNGSYFSSWWCPLSTHFSNNLYIIYNKETKHGTNKVPFSYIYGGHTAWIRQATSACVCSVFMAISGSIGRAWFVGSYLLLPGSSGSQSIDGLYFYPCRGAGRACPKLVACIVRVRMARPYILRRIVSLRPRHGSVAGRQVSIWRMLLSRIPVPSGASSRSVYHSYCWKTWRSRRGSRLWRVSSRPSLEQR